MLISNEAMFTDHLNTETREESSNCNTIIEHGFDEEN